MTSVLDHLRVGGWVVVPILTSGFVMWMLIWLRWSIVSRAVSISSRDDVVRFAFGRELGRFRGALRTITHLAPLLGLLGTVRGMIATFDAMAAGGGLAPADGVAGGIAEALVTTQLGLMVAIPGLLIGRFLDHREYARRVDFGLVDEVTT